MKLFELFATLSLDSGGFDRGLTQAEQTLQNVTGKVESFGRMLKVAVTTGALAKAGQYIAKTGLGYNRTIEDYTANMQTLLGGTDKAEAKIKELSKMAATTPFELSNLADATQTLLAFGVESDKSTGILKSLGDISLGNADKLQTLTRAYGKMSSTGKVTLENVQMMIDAGFNPLNLIAERNNMAMEDLYKALSDGKVPFSELEWAIKKATSAGGQFYGGMETASKTLSGRLATLSDNWSAFLGAVTKPAYEVLKDTVLPDAIDMVDDLTAALDEDGLKGVWDTVTARMSSAGSNIATKITEYFDSDQAAQDLQATTGKIARLMTSGNIVLADVLGFATSIIGKIGNTLSNPGVKANMAAIGAQIAKSIVNINAAKVRTIINGVDIAISIGTALITGIGNYFATADLGSIVSSLADGIVKLGVSAIKALPSIVSAAAKIALGLVNAVAMAIPEVGKSIIDGFAQLFTPDAQNKLTAQLSRMRSTLQGLDKDVRDAQGTYNTSMSRIEARTSLAGQYLDTIEALEQKDKLTSQDYENWQNAVTALTNMYPELKDLVNGETGLFTANTTEIRNNIAALNDLAKTKAMSNMLTSLSESAAGYVESMVDANVQLKEISANANAANSSLSKFNEYFPVKDWGSPQLNTTAGLEALTANQVKLLESTEAGKTMLQDFYSIAMDGTATLLNEEYTDMQAVATALQASIDAVRAELEEKKTELDAQKTEMQAQIDAAQAQLDAVNAKKDAIMASYDELFASVKSNAETAGQTAESIGNLYTKQQESANAAKLDIGALVDAWNNVPTEYKTTYTIETLNTTPTFEPQYRYRPHATGLYDVPYDGYAAILHAGERVLTRAQADESRKPKASQKATQDVYNINIQSTAESPSETAAYIKQAMRTLRFNQA